MPRATGREIKQRLAPGPKPKDQSELAVKKSVSLRPETYEGLVALGEGMLSPGIEAAYQLVLKARRPRR